MAPQLTIPSTDITNPPDGNKPYTTYTIAISTPSSLRPSQIFKRYTEFEALDKALRAETNAPSPASLPAKSWFSKTVGNEKLTEERRKGLEGYMQAIETAENPQWRNSVVWKEFLGTPTAGSKSDKSRHFDGSRGAGGLNGGAISSSSAWLEAHNELKSQLHIARMALARREQATTPTSQHEAGAAAKKALLRSGTLIAKLEDGLRRMSGNKTMSKEDLAQAEILGEGEIRRRRDLISAARKEREGLENVLNTLAVKSAVAGLSNPGQQSAAATAGAKKDLFQGPDGTSSSPSAPKLYQSGGGRRVLGGPPPKETEKTRELDNQGIVQLQKQIMETQDLDVEDLTKAVRRMKEMGIMINEELEEQSTLLNLVDEDVDRLGGKIDVAKKRIRKIN
ncbi:hypothetical protein K402DRAFT_394958 [Aulographum hederae CBS 113979]|uniref:Phox-like protein n=1 Tax=Aulographum hederae CBS 113979 TaxID=1176131 RepID=A0A6G1GWS4_9PEZI|nr:hypothetical protein K402DRAFT_394958 [Aulographum hederae CBS 113979]